MSEHMTDDRYKPSSEAARSDGGQRVDCQNRQNVGSVSFVGTDKAADAGWSQPVGRPVECEAEAWAERAAILEFDANLPRRVAEIVAAELLEFGPTRFQPVTFTSIEAVVSRRDWADMRPCVMCRNLLPEGQCLAAIRQQLRGSRDYRPSMPRQARRCVQYWPTMADPDQTRGIERWPELERWQ